MFFARNDVLCSTEVQKEVKKKEEKKRRHLCVSTIITHSRRPMKTRNELSLLYNEFQIYSQKIDFFQRFEDIRGTNFQITYIDPILNKKNGEKNDKSKIFGKEA